MNKPKQTNPKTVGKHHIFTIQTFVRMITYLQRKEITIDSSELSYGLHGIGWKAAMAYCVLLIEPNEL